MAFNPFSFDPPYNDNGQASSAPSAQVESLSLPELMKNEHVQTMYNNWKDASAQVVQATQMQQTLWHENTRLNAEVTALREQQHQTL